MIGAGKHHVHQSQERAKKAFRLAQRQVKQQPERECCLNRQLRVHRLSATLSSLRRYPGIDGVLTDPQGDVATLAE